MHKLMPNEPNYTRSASLFPLAHLYPHGFLAECDVKKALKTHMPSPFLRAFGSFSSFRGRASTVPAPSLTVKH